MVSVRNDPVSPFPTELAPVLTETIRFASGGTIDLPKATPSFLPWLGPPIASTYGRKAVLDSNGVAVFAELAILACFERAGWAGAWIDTYSRRMRRAYSADSVDVVLPSITRNLLEAIYGKAGNRSGAFDVVAWRGGDTVFAESKRKDRDRILPTQCAWIEAAIAVGVRPDQLLIVEWRLQ